MTTERSFQRLCRWVMVVAMFSLLTLSACRGGGEASVTEPSEQTRQTGSRIVFGQFDDAIEDFLLFTADPDGSNIESLMSTAAECPRWAPDGSPMLLVCVPNTRGLLRPATVRADGSRFTLLDNPDPSLNIGCWGWSPDGTRLVCESWDEDHPGRNGIYSVRSSDGGDLQRLTVAADGDHDIPGGYSPDGSRIVFTGTKPGDPETCAVFVMDADGSHEQRITSYGATSCGYTAWSSAGDEIVLANGGLAVVHPDGMGLRQIPLEGLDGTPSAFAPAWSPDGTRILFSLSLPGSESDLYSIGLNGTDLTQVTDTPGVEEDLANWGTVTAP